MCPSKAERERERKREMEGEREMGECSGLFFYKDTNIIMATTLLTSHEPKYLPEALPPNIITLRVRASPCEIWGDTNIQCITEEN